MLSVWELLKFTWVVFRRNSALFLGYAAWILIPDALVLFFSSVFPNDQNTILIVLQAIQLVLGIWLYSLFVMFTSSITQSKKINLKSITQRASAIMLPVFFASLLAGINVLAGLIFFIIPGIIFMVWYAFAEQEVILENKRGIAAMAASRDKVKGKFWATLWRLFAGNLSILAFYLTALSLIYSFARWLSQVPPENWSAQLTVATQTAQGIVDVVFLPIFAIFSTILYLEVSLKLPSKKL